MSLIRSRLAVISSRYSSSSELKNAKIEDSDSEVAAVDAELAESNSEVAVVDVELVESSDVMLSVSKSYGGVAMMDGELIVAANSPSALCRVRIWWFLACCARSVI